MFMDHSRSWGRAIAPAAVPADLLGSLFLHARNIERGDYGVYAYVKADPVNFVDPTGTACVSFRERGSTTGSGNEGTVTLGQLVEVCWTDEAGGGRNFTGGGLGGGHNPGCRVPMKCAGAPPRPTPPPTPAPKDPPCKPAPTTTAGALRSVGRGLADAGDIGTILFGSAAIATSGTVVGGGVFGALAAGSRGISALGNALDFGGAVIQGDSRGAIGAGAGVVAGPLGGRISNSLRSMAGVGGRYGQNADRAARIGTGRAINEAICAGPS